MTANYHAHKEFLNCGLISTYPELSSLINEHTSNWVQLGVTETKDGLTTTVFRLEDQPIKAIITESSDTVVVDYKFFPEWDVDDQELMVTGCMMMSNILMMPSSQFTKSL